MEQSSIPVLTTPKLESAIMAAHAAAPQTRQYLHLRRPDRWTSSIDLLNAAVREQKVYNVDVQDAKSWLSSGIEDAIDEVETAIRRKVRDANEQRYLRFADIVYANVGILQMNYAAGRIKRLSAPKVLTGIREVAPEIDEYLGLLQEVAAIWATITALKPYIVKGRKPAENPKVADLTHTGLCPACFGTFKLTSAGTLVHHGFQISIQGHYLGYRMGSCFGVGYRPYEKTAEGTKAYHAHVTEILKAQQENLRKHLGGEITEVTREVYERVPGLGIQSVTKTYKIDHDLFETFLAQDISKIRWAIQSTENHLADLQVKIDLWKLTPLYDEIHPPKKEE